MDNVTMPASQAVAPFEVLGLDGNIATAYAAMLLMAMLPIYVGAWRSLKHRHKVRLACSQPPYCAAASFAWDSHTWL